MKAAPTRVDSSQKVDWDQVVYSLQHDYIEEGSYSDAAEIQEELTGLKSEQKELNQQMRDLKKLISQAQKELKDYDKIIGKNSS